VKSKESIDQFKRKNKSENITSYVFKEWNSVSIERNSESVRIYIIGIANSLICGKLRFDRYPQMDSKKDQLFTRNLRTKVDSHLGKNGQEKHSEGPQATSWNWSVKKEDMKKPEVCLTGRLISCFFERFVLLWNVSKWNRQSSFFNSLEKRAGKYFLWNIGKP
jgi:hypothetical protein